MSRSVRAEAAQLRKVVEALPRPRRESPEDPSSVIWLKVLRLLERALRRRGGPPDLLRHIEESIAAVEEYHRLGKLVPTRSPSARACCCGSARTSTQFGPAYEDVAARLRE